MHLDEPVRVNSARRQFAKDCEASGLPPLPLLINRDDTDAVNLNNYRLGDSLAIALSDGLLHVQQQGMTVRQLRLANCGLAAPSTTAMAKVISTFSELTFLDLTENRIGSAGTASLQSALASHRHIQEVILAKNRLGDRVCGKLLSALVGHPSLTSLDLSANEMGLSPLLHGPLATVLEAEGQLTRLKLGWNSLNVNAMVAIADPLRSNTKLTHLDLSWNALEDRGGVKLGSILRFNKGLTFLNIANNEIRERGGIVLSDMLKENTVLQHVCFDGNPLGVRGGRALLRGLHWMIMFGIKHREIRIRKCNFSYFDKGEVLFDPVNPGGVWENNLQDPYERVRASELVELAWSQPGENWMDETLDDKPFELPEPREHQVLTREDYKLPEEGVLSVTYVSSARAPKMADVVPAAVFYELVRLMSDKMLTDRGLAIVRLAAQEFYFTSEYAGTLISKFSDTGARVEAAALLLPRAVDVCNWNAFVFSCLTDGELSRLENRMGSLFNFVPRNPTGHYRLELASEADRQIAVMLIKISSEEKTERRGHAKNYVNSSQRGDWDNWRNESIDELDGSGPEEFDFDENKPISIPQHGTLEFDYVSTNTHFRSCGSSCMPNIVFRLFKQDLLKVTTVLRIKSRNNKVAGSSLAEDSEAEIGSRPTTAASVESRPTTAATTTTFESEPSGLPDALGAETDNSGPQPGEGSPRPQSRTSLTTKKPKRKKKKKKAEAALTEEEIAQREMEAAILIQRIYRSYRVRWGTLHLTLMMEALAIEKSLIRQRGWRDWVREHQDVPVEQLDQAATTIQNCWRGKCAREIVRRTRMKKMNEELEKASVDHARRNKPRNNILRPVRCVLTTIFALFCATSIHALPDATKTR